MKKVSEILKRNTYPGRGIITGYSEDGVHASLAYFIMGRSENSRNRVFVRDGDDVIIKAFDESKLVDPSLVIYTPLRMVEDTAIITNGDQTDTIYDFMLRGKSFEQALKTRCYEPDSPNFTPRISAVINKYGYKQSILKYHMGTCLRETFDYEPMLGTGHLIHTYRCDGDPIPSFEGEPVAVEIGNDPRAFADEIWQSLHEGNKVSLLVRFVDIEKGTHETVIINRNKSSLGENAQ